MYIVAKPGKMDAAQRCYRKPEASSNQLRALGSHHYAIEVPQSGVQHSLQVTPVQPASAEIRVASTDAPRVVPDRQTREMPLHRRPLWSVLSFRAASIVGE
jgi:hypothetical protein